MSIAKRLMILIAIPLVVLIFLGAFLSVQFDRISEQSRFISVVQVGSLTTMGRITRSFSEMRVNLRGIMLAKDHIERDQSRARLKEDQRELREQFQKYEASFISDEQDKAMFDSFRQIATEWEQGAAEIMLFVGADDMEGAQRLLNTGTMLKVGPRASQALDAWNDYNTKTSQRLSAAAFQEMSVIKLEIGLAVGFAVVISCAVAYLTYRRITLPIQNLNETVQRIADGDYAVEVPYLKGANRA